MARSFFFHYNKPASQKAGKAQISVHFRGLCLIVDNVRCSVPTTGRIKRTAPKFVMTGKANYVNILNGEAVIT